jgi:integrase
MTRGRYGNGTIDERGENTFRLRYRIDQHRYSVTFRGTWKEANAKLRELLGSGDDGTHIEPNKMTLREWADHWLASGAPGREMEAVGTRSVERYGQLLRVHVLPVLGNRKLQQIDGIHIDALYLALDGKLAPATFRHLHATLGACLATAVRTKKLAISPMASLTKRPPKGESNHGTVLTNQELHRLVRASRVRTSTASSPQRHSLECAETRYWRYAGTISTWRRRPCALNARLKKP